MCTSVSEGPSASIDRYLKVFTLVMETAGNCETLVRAYQATLFYPKRWLVLVQGIKVYNN